MPASRPATQPGHDYHHDWQVSSKYHQLTIQHHHDHHHHHHDNDEKMGVEGDLVSD